MTNIANELAIRRAVTFNGAEVCRTPLLVPSFSSKGFPDVDKIIRTTADVIEGPLLVSAYDLHYSHINPPFDFASLIFLDSGGYEASRDAELSDYGSKEHRPAKWSQEFHNETVDSWNARSPTVVISYDHPSERLPLHEQVARARALMGRKDQVLRELLIKPETATQSFLRMDSLLDNVRGLAGFDILGVTEKEIGSSILDRMVNIARLRTALTKVGLGSIPIHVFGSLDTITTPLYFFAGADIFDGLTWLRFAFHKGFTVYKQNYTAEVGLDVKMHMTDVHCWVNNYRYLSKLQLDMRRFLNSRNFNEFGEQSQLFEKAFGSMIEQLKG